VKGFEGKRSSREKRNRAAAEHLDKAKCLEGLTAWTAWFMVYVLTSDGSPFTARRGMKRHNWRGWPWTTALVVQSEETQLGTHHHHMHPFAG